MESGGGRVDPPQGDRTNRGGGGRGGGRGLADGGHQEDSAAAALKGHGHEAKTTWPEEMKVSRPCPSSPRTSSVTSPTSTGAFRACVRAAKCKLCCVHAFSIRDAKSSERKNAKV